jgi:hypothetical protein
MLNAKTDLGLQGLSPHRGDEATHGRDAGGQPDETRAWKETGKVEVEAAVNGEMRCLKTNPFT